MSNIQKEVVQVADWLALEIPDNLEAAAQDPANHLDHYKKLALSGIAVLELRSWV